MEPFSIPLNSFTSLEDDLVAFVCHRSKLNSFLEQNPTFRLN